MVDNLTSENQIYEMFGEKRDRFLGSEQRGTCQGGMPSLPEQAGKVS